MKNYKNESLSLIQCDIMQLFPLEYVKNYLRIDNDYDDEFIKNIVATACNCAESITNKMIGLKTFRLNFTTNAKIFVIQHDIYMNDIVSLSENNIILNKTQYYLDNGVCKINNGICGNISITFTAGTTYSEINLDIRQAIMYHIASIYNNKEGSISIPPASQEIYNMYRQIKL